MADKTYYTLVTDAGNAAITAAPVTGEKVKAKYFVVGDGGGAYYEPTADMTGLRNERWSGLVNSYEIDPDSSNVIIVTAVVPASVGGFTMREMGVKTEEGLLIAVGNMPDTEKVTLASGAEGEVEIIMRIIVANTNDLVFEIDPNVVTATKRDIERHNDDPDAHAALLAGFSSGAIILSDDDPPEGVKLHIYAVGESLTYTPKEPQQQTPDTGDGVEVVLQADDGSIYPEPLIQEDGGSEITPALQIQ
jgi:phage-related tail fiber protein